MKQKPRFRLGFTVSGTPVPQGSKRLLNRATGTFGEDAGARHYSWRMDVTGMARQAMADHGRFGEPFREPISCVLTFSFRRPQVHYGTGKNAEKLKPSAPSFPSKPPDLDKLTRAVWDALTSVVWVDDGQVVAATIRKQWVDRWQEDGVHIVVGTFDTEGDDLGE